MAKKKKKKKQPETGMERLKAMPLWQWGLITIFAGLVSNVILGMGPTGTSAAARGQAAGRAVASALFIIIGIGLIIADVVRRNK